MKACLMLLIAALVACSGGGDSSTTDQIVGEDLIADLDAVVGETLEDIEAESTVDVIGPEEGEDVPLDFSGIEADLPNIGACCGSDDECSLGLVCAKPGVCKPKPEAGQCWDSTDCEKGLVCEGAFVCPCTADCGKPDQTGTCKLKPGCCSTVVDCGEGNWSCVTDSEVEHGVCKSLDELEKGQCWSDQDCTPPWICKDVEVCPCGYSCDTADVPGVCMLGFGCCLDDQDCGGPDMSCVPTGDEFGVCKSSKELETGKCWTNKDCAPVGVCEGVEVCPCNAYCDTMDMPGNCQLPKGCCLTDADCGEGAWTCVDIGYEYGMCRHAGQLSEGECWVQDDCAPEEFCALAFIPSCLEPMPLTAGTCVSLPEGCCESDADCGDDLVCRGLSPSLPGRCVAAPGMALCPEGAVCCWQDSDCPAGQVCKDALVCGCIALCPMCGDCAPDQIGICSE